MNFLKSIIIRLFIISLWLLRIENTLDLLIAVFVLRRQKEIGNMILLCGNKYYSRGSTLESLEKHHHRLI